MSRRILCEERTTWEPGATGLRDLRARDAMTLGKGSRLAREKPLPRNVTRGLELERGLLSGRPYPAGQQGGSQPICSSTQEWIGRALLADNIGQPDPRQRSADGNRIDVLPSGETVAVSGQIAPAAIEAPQEYLT
jgi:hypothetical protein